MSFSGQIKQAADKYKRRIRATCRESVQETVNIAQTTRFKGGRMRFDTGFLRASIQAAIGNMPSGPTTGDGNYTEGQIAAGEPVGVTLLKWQLDRPLFVGWTASYARPREHLDGFMRGATEQWPQTVDRVAKKVRARI